MMFYFHPLIHHILNGQIIEKPLDVILEIAMLYFWIEVSYECSTRCGDQCGIFLAGCNRVGVAYSIGMTSGPNFEFTMGSSLSRRNFVSEVYDKIVADFSAKMNINNIGALSGSTAQENLKTLNFCIYFRSLDQKQHFLIET